MMFKYRPIKIFLMTLLIIVFTTFAVPGVTQQERLIFISEVSGIVQLKRPQWAIYQPVRFGDFLNPLDILKLTKSSSAKVICDNLQIWNPKLQGEFAVSQGCPSSTRQVLKRPDAKTSRTREKNNPAVPYLISPRNTAIFNPRPIFRWNPVPGATSYEIKISERDLNWKTTVKEPQVVYAGNQPFVPEFRYRVTITANNGISSENERDNPGFSILSDADTQRIKAEIAQLQQTRLNQQSKTLALANLYRSNGLQSEAIDLLEGFVKNGIGNTAVYQLLGDTYYQVGLMQLAKTWYLKTLPLAKVEKNLEAQAIIQGTLGEIDTTLAELKSASRWFENAQNNYRALGDKPKVQEMQQRLNYLKPRISG